MKRKLKVAQYGCGAIGSMLMSYIFEKGADIVAAFDVNPAVIGKDIGELIGCGAMGTAVSDAKDALTVMTERKPDICLIATKSAMRDLAEPFKICAKSGVNAIATGEEAVYPWNSSPDITKELDALAKQYGVTFSGSGFPDMYWGLLVDTMAGSMQRIIKIEGISVYSAYGETLAAAHGVGLTQTKFAEQFGIYNDLSSNEQQVLVEDGIFLPSYMWNQNGWLCSKMKLTPVSQKQICTPIVHQADLYCGDLKKTIPAGCATGLKSIVTTETKEGIIIETICVGRVFEHGEYDYTEWRFLGTPDTAMRFDKTDTLELTCANLINRIPALLKSRPGYITTDCLENSVYLQKPINEYISDLE